MPVDSTKKLCHEPGIKALLWCRPAELALALIMMLYNTPGEVSSRCGNTPATGFNAPATPSSGGVTHPPKAASPRMHPPRSSPRDTSTTSLRGPSVAPKSDSKDIPQNISSRGGPSGKGKGLAGVDEGDEGEKAKPERRDGIVEREVSEADDLVVCVLHPGGEEDGRESDG